MKRKVGKRFKIIFIVLLVITVPFLFIGEDSFARYVYEGIKDYYLETKSFYFNCDKMDSPRAFYQIDNWAGGGNFDITFNMNSSKNNLVNSTGDIYYNVTYSCSSNVSCTATKTSGMIPSSSNIDFFIVSLNPTETLDEGDVVWLEVHAYATSPYEKEISGRVELHISIPGLNYEIEDNAYQPYLNFKVTNTLDFYEVRTAFDTYDVGDRINIDTYLALSEENQDKCASAMITLAFDPNVVLIDLTSEIYGDMVSTTTMVIDGYDYINSVTFKSDAISSMIIRFYKVESSNDYTYPFVTESPVITFVSMR